MSQLSEGPVLGLRERKKAKTKAAIQQQAVRLFRDRGYAATTVEQVAEAAEVSASTVFRYFPTKEDLVISDDYDPLFIESFRAQPAGLTPIQAFRAAVTGAFTGLSAAELDAQRGRELLIFTVPELWAASLDNVNQGMRLTMDLVAERVGRDPDDVAVRTFTAAVLGVLLEVMLRWARDPSLDIVAEVDTALERLEAGLPL
jgi:AcrR family transcriptional regulator